MLEQVDTALSTLEMRGNKYAQSTGEVAIGLLNLASEEALWRGNEPPGATGRGVGGGLARTSITLGGAGLSLEPDYQGPLEPVGGQAPALSSPAALPWHERPAFVSVFLAALARGGLLLPRRKWSGELTLVPVPLSEGASTPSLFLIEEYELMARSIGFGLGRTVRVTTFLPGTTLSIPLIAWRPSDAAIATTVLDSFSVYTANEFAAGVRARLRASGEEAVSRAFEHEIIPRASESHHVV